jgi:diguanylate cyclase (GGDEF)-like protein
MPQKMWKHRCPKGGGGLSWSGSPMCGSCGRSGEYDGWHPRMHEAMARYQSQYGLKPIGPHRRLADELLGAAKEECSGCRGRGLVDASDGSTWQVCEPCRGFGSCFTKPAEEIETLRRRILATYPDAAASAVPNFFTGTPALGLANQEMVDLSRAKAPDAEPAAPPPGQLSDRAWQQDVLTLLPPPEDTAHLDRVWGLTADSSPLQNLTLWHPTDPGDLELRRVLLDFGHRVRRAEAPHTATLKELAFKDEVTGLYNGRFFSIRLDEEVARHRRSNDPVSLVLLHLDGLRRINDERGRAAGDEILRAVADILLKQTRGINVVSRHDGGLFAIVLVGTSLGGARLYMERIRHVLASAAFGQGRSVTVRFGSASLPEDGARTADDLVRHADQRLRVARPDRG